MPPFTWNQYLILSKTWYAQVSSNPAHELSEAIYRNIISRAYYGALNHARSYATGLEKDPLKLDLSHDTSTHEKIIIYLNSHKRVQAALCLRRLKKLRVKCDYHDTVSENKGWLALCQESIQDSEYIFNALTIHP